MEDSLRTDTIEGTYGYYREKKRKAKEDTIREQKATIRSKALDLAVVPLFLAMIFQAVIDNKLIYLLCFAMFYLIAITTCRIIVTSALQPQKKIVLLFIPFSLSLMAIIVPVLYVEYGVYM